MYIPKIKQIETRNIAESFEEEQMLNFRILASILIVRRNDGNGTV